VDSLYNNGAHYYIQKPASFEQLIHVLEQMLSLPEEKKRIRPAKEDFIISYGH
jgi:FixJ family two-component response regulator